MATAVVFWLPVLGHPRRVSGLAAGAYLLVANMLSDGIGAWYMAMGQTGAGVAMVAGMLPVAARVLSTVVSRLVTSGAHGTAGMVDSVGFLAVNVAQLVIIAHMVRRDRRRSDPGTSHVLS